MPNKHTSIKTNDAMSKSLKITGIYFAVGSVWIILTDIISKNFFAENVLIASIVKGLFYVIVTAALIYSLIYPALKKIIIVQEKLQKVNSQLEQSNLDLQIEKQKLLDSELKLNESETLFRAIFDQATIGIAIGHNDSNITSVFKERPSINPMFEKILGRTKEELANTNWMDITHPADLPADLESFEKFKAGIINSYDMEKRYIRPDGSEAWIHMFISPLHMDNNPEYNHLCIIEDIGKRKEMEKFLFDSERSKAILLDNLPGMAYRCNYDRDWTMLFVSQGCFELTGYKAESLLYNKEKSFNELIDYKYREYIWNKWARVIKEKTKFTEEYKIITASGGVKWVFEQGQGIYDGGGNVIALEGLIIDITDRKRHEIKLKYINDHDLLTGLYNRRYFEENITRDLERNDEQKRAVLLLNLRKFNLLISNFGYTYGENLVKELASSLDKLCNENCQLFHISIDRFIFYVKGYKQKNELTALCDTITEMLNDTFAAKTIGGDIGIVEIDNIKYDVESILKNASIVTSYVNENKIFGYSFFNKDMEDKIIREVNIKNELTKAAYDNSDDSLYMQYQPVVDLKTNSIYGFEALARFNSDRMGVISPLEFIPIAEETQLIVPLGKRIMRMVFQFLKKLEKNGHENVAMSFNISAIQLLGDNFLSDLNEVINETEVDPYKLSIEITESIFSNNYQEMNKKLEKIKGLGIKIAIDDFGTGYSTLARERELNINCLKIDKYFIDKLIQLDVNEAITGDIISMAHKLGHFVIAEGVEHEKQMQYLIEHNCDLMQGYFFSKPLSCESAIDILNKANQSK
jgi:PAS domain S-box